MRAFTTALVPIVLLAGCAVPGLVADLDDFEPIQSADWQPGFEFAFAGSDRIDVTGWSSEDGGETLDVHEQSPAEPLYGYTVLNTEFDQDGIPYYLVGLDLGANTNPSAATGLLAIRESDLQPMPTTISANGQQATVHVGILPYDYSLLKFPLQKGASWSGNFPFEDMIGGGPMGDASLRVDSLVRGAHQIDTALGSHYAVRIEHLLTAPGLEQAMDAARAAAAAQGVVIERFDMSMDVRILVDYVPALHNVARQELVVKQSMDVAASYEGQREEFWMNAEAHALIELTKAELVAGPQVAVPELGKELGIKGTTTIAGAGPEPMVGGSDPNVSIRLEAQESDLLLPGGATGFSIDVDGSSAKPTITVTNADPAFTQVVTGPDYFFEPTAPGTYVARAAVPGAESNPVDISVALADDFDAACSASLPVAPSACGAVPVVLGAGVEELRISIGGSAPAIGTLVFTDSLGETYTQAVDVMGGELVVSEPVSGEGSVRFEPTINVAPSVTYHVEADPGDNGFFGFAEYALPQFRGLL